MFPHVQAQDGGGAGADACHQRAVLVAAAFHGQLAVLAHHQPGPAAAKARERGLGEGGLEGIEAAQFPVNGLCQFARGSTAAALVHRGHHGPEQAVVGVPAAVVAHGTANAFGQQGQVGDQLLHGLAAVRRVLERGIQVVHIGLMVLGVVDLHGLRIDMGLQRVVGVAQGRQGVVAHVVSFRDYGEKIGALRCLCGCNQCASLGGRAVAVQSKTRAEA